MVRLLASSLHSPNVHKTRQLLTTEAVENPKPPPNNDRLYLTANELKILIHTAKTTGRNKARNALILLMGFRHGLRVGELVDLRWSDVDFTAGLLFVRRLKDGISTHHALERDEIQGLHVLQRSPKSSPFVFNSELGVPITEDGIRKMMMRVGVKAKLPFHCHPHQLRHSCGVHLAARGVSPLTIKTYLGHWSLRNTLHYCELADVSTSSLWRERSH